MSTKTLRKLSGWAAGLLSSVCWLTTGLAQSVPADSVRHRIILIGDAGRLRNGKNPVVDAVAGRYSLNDSRTTLVYLGDNVYPHGLSDENSPGYGSYVETLRYQARPGLNDSGLDGSGLARQSGIVFIPGNHDWAQGRPDGWDNIRRQGRWLDSLNAPNVRLLPADGCPGPEEIRLSDKVVLVVLDSQWWLHPHAKPGLESDCACKTEEDVTARLVDIAHRHKDKGIILATHHPFRSYGIHGGYYTLKQHLFPFTDSKPNFYLPLPLVGSIYPLVRGVFGTIQDLPNPTYRTMIRTIEKAMAPAPNVVFVSGHDHALQHIVDGSRQYIVSGSGINRERVKRGKRAKFVSPEWGYVVLDELASGRLTATFYTVDEGANATEAYTATLFTLPSLSASGSSFRRQPIWPDSVRVAIAPAFNRLGRFHRWLPGNNYRTEWATPVPLPVVDLTRSSDSIVVQDVFQDSIAVRDTTRLGNNRLSYVLNDGINVVKTVAFTYARPLHWQKRNFLILGGSLLGSASALLIDQKVYNLAQRHQTKAFDRMERVGFWLGKPTVNYPFMLTVWGSGIIASNDWLRDTGVMVIASVTASGIIQTAAKGLVGRARPVAGRGAFWFDPVSSQHSFPSGHTMLSVATAWILAKQVNFVPLKIAFYALPVITGASRIYVGAHWLSDILLGSALGIACAESVLRLYPVLKARQASYSLRVVPGVNSAGILVCF